MKFTFGFYNCYWLFITNAKELEYALENLLMVNDDVDYYVELLTAGHTIFLNEAGGFHYGDPAEKTQQITKLSPKFPTKSDRVKVMEKEIIADIHAMQDAAGLPRTENISFA